LGGRELVILSINKNKDAAECRGVESDSYPLLAISKYLVPAFPTIFISYFRPVSAKPPFIDKQPGNADKHGEAEPSAIDGIAPPSDVVDHLRHRVLPIKGSDTMEIEIIIV